MNIEGRLKQDFAFCAKIQKKHGKSYYFATLFLPREKKLATHALYAFFRMPDEFVDNPEVKDDSAARKKLLDWKKEWERAYRTGGSDDPVLNATSFIFKEFKIPYEYSISFLDAMIMDTEKKSYRDYDELKRYMFGSAAVVGLMMIHVIGYSDEKALGYAEDLGYAMQLTNFLRDVKEDYEVRGRIYLPAEEMKTFGMTQEDLSLHSVSGSFISLMKFQIQRARALYRNADKGFLLLNKDGRFAVKTASVLYEAILDKIEKQQYDIFAGRAHTGLIEKILLAMKGARTDG